MKEKQHHVQLTATTPFEYDNEIANQFFDLYARILIAWSRIERAVDVILFNQRVFQNNGRKGIVNWSEKYKALKSNFQENPNLENVRKQALSLLDEINEFTPIRHTFVHGLYLGVSDETPPRVHIRKSRFNEGPVENTEYRLSIDDLQNILNDLRSIDREFGFFMFALLLSPKRSLQLKP